nr:NAD(P)H-binding protein [Mycobacterium sp. Marseille-P9652]
MGEATTVAVVGATGCAGSRVVARLRARNVAVVEVSRDHGVDLLTGQGLPRALDGVDVVVDVSDPAPGDRWSTIADALATAARNLVGACAARDVRRLVVATIAGIEDPAFDGIPYYEGKRAARNIALDSPVPATVVKSTQWFEFATNPAAVEFGEDEVIVQDWLIQPIAADTVADVLVEAALGQTHAPRTITGPHPVRLPELTSRLLELQGDGRPVRPVPPPVAALAGGGLLPSDRAVVVGPDADTWLHSLAPAVDAKRGRGRRPDYSRT